MTIASEEGSGAAGTAIAGFSLVGEDADEDAWACGCWRP